MNKFCLTALLVCASSAFAAPATSEAATCQFKLTNSAGQEFAITTYEDIQVSGLDYEIATHPQPTLQDGESQIVDCHGDNCVFTIDALGAVMCPPVESIEKHYKAKCGDTVDVSAIKSHDENTAVIIGECKTSLDPKPEAFGISTESLSLVEPTEITGTADCTETFLDVLGDTCVLASDCCTGQVCTPDANGEGYCAKMR